MGLTKWKREGQIEGRRDSKGVLGKTSAAEGGDREREKTRPKWEEGSAFRVKTKINTK